MRGAVTDQLGATACVGPMDMSQHTQRYDRVTQELQAGQATLHVRMLKVETNVDDLLHYSQQTEMLIQCLCHKLKVKGRVAAHLPSMDTENSMDIHDPRLKRTLEQVQGEHTVMPILSMQNVGGAWQGETQLGQ